MNQVIELVTLVVIACTPADKCNEHILARAIPLSQCKAMMERDYNALPDPAKATGISTAIVTCKSEGHQI